MAHFFITLVAAALMTGSITGRTYIVQFVSLPNDIKASSLELLTGEGKSISIEAPHQSISKPYRVEQLKHWKVGKFDNAPDGTRTFTEYGSVKALDTRHQLVILIRKGETNADGFKLVVAGNGITQFGGGHYLLVNGTDKDVGAKFGNKQSIIVPGAYGVTRPKADEGKRVCNILFSYRKKEEMKPFFSTNWPVNANARSLIFFYADPKTNRIAMHTIRDYVDE